MRKKRMRLKIRISRNNEELFYGKPIDLPIKEQFIIDKSIELFDDEDPCIIHQSYVIKEFADQLITLFRANDTQTVLGKDYITELAFLDVTDVENLTFELEG